MHKIYAINTYQCEPIKVKRLGLFRAFTNINGETRASELCEVTYPLPEAPEHAICNILEWIAVYAFE